MKIDTATLSPWAEVNTILSRMSSLVVVIDGAPYSGEAELTRDEATGRVTLAFETPDTTVLEPVKPKKKAA